MARASRGASRKSANIVTVDFEGVEGRRELVDPGEYPAKVVEVERVVQRGKDDYLRWTFEIIGDEFEGSKLYTNTSLSQAALWNLRGLLEALGEEVPDSELGIDLTEMADKEIMLVVDHEDYNNRPQARIVDYAPLEEEPAPKAGKKKTPAKKAGKKTLDPISQDDVNEMDQEALETLAEEYGLDIDFKALKVLRKMTAAVIDALEEAEMLGEPA